MDCPFYISELDFCRENHDCKCNKCPTQGTFYYKFAFFKYKISNILRRVL